ncbi:MAG: uracil-DNA glycosylase [Eggerthella lenta]
MTKPHIPLDEIRAQVEGCRKCPLADGRTQTVFGVGNPEARVMIIGEAPGKNEDLQGEPFVGAAGKYLNELLAVAGLVREDVFIANVLNRRPPGNRDPPRGDRAMHAVPARADAHHRSRVPDAGNFTKFILKTDIGITRLHGTVQRAGKLNSPSSTRRPRCTTVPSARRWVTSPRWASCCEAKPNPRRRASRRPARRQRRCCNGSTQAPSVPCSYSPLSKVFDSGLL